MPARKLFRITSVVIDDGDDQDDDYYDAWEEILCYRISSNQPGNPNQPAYFILFWPKAQEHFSSELTFTEKNSNRKLERKLL